MPPRVLSVTFAVDTYESKQGLNVPKDIVALLGLKSDNNDRDIALTVASPTGNIVFHGIGRLTSGTEICSGDAIKNLPLHERVIVTASRPPGQ